MVGVNEGDGYGVVGDATSAIYSGVWGRNYGVGAGVRGASVRNNGVGVSGKGKYCGQFEGGKVQLRLVPGSSAGAPGGAHSKGEVYMDSAATLWVCVAGGNPATWKKVTTS